MSSIKEQISERFEIPIEDIQCINCEEYGSQDDGSYFCNYWELEDNMPQGFCSFWWPKGEVKEE